MTPRERVLKRWPNAKIVSYAGPAWVVFNGEYVNLALNISDPTPKQAWQVAEMHWTIRKHRRTSTGAKAK